MRNLFDQYDQPENKVTHALMVALDKDRVLLKAFLKLINIKPPVKPAQLELEEQAVVGQLEESEQEADRKGLPDGWIHDGEQWSLLIESKISSRLTKDQIERHHKTAERAGFTDITVLSIEAVLNRINEPGYLLRLEWQDVYRLLKQRQLESPWAAMAAEYFEIAESKFTDSGYLKEGNLTVFSGIHFGQEKPYTYTEAKRLIKLIMEALRQDKDFCQKAGIDSNIPGRGAITGKQGSAVWDYLSHQNSAKSKDFTNHPHFTLGINQQRLHISITIPNNTETQYRNRLKGLTFDEFQQLIATVVGEMEPLYSKDEGYSPWCTAVQRRYKSQRAHPTHDAVLEFDLRTAIGDGNSSVKPQIQWLQAAFDAYCEKKSNYQLQIGAAIYFDKSETIKTEKALDQIKQTWLACGPLLDLMIH
jgi:hypothetical protein